MLTQSLAHVRGAQQAEKVIGNASMVLSGIFLWLFEEDSWLQQLSWSCHSGTVDREDWQIQILHHQIEQHFEKESMLFQDDVWPNQYFWCVQRALYRAVDEFSLQLA